MEITFKRTQYTKNSTISELIVDGRQIGWGLEDVVRPSKSKKVWGQTAIPAGRYRCIINMSPKFKRAMPLLLDVPGYEGVRIHWGNDQNSSDGCLLVGKSYNMKHPDWISESRAMFAELYTLMEDALKNNKLILVNVVDTKVPVI